MKVNNKNNNSVGGVIFDIANYIFLGLYGLLCILPFLYIIAGSFATETEIKTRAFFIIPKTFNLEAYKYIMTSDSLFRSIMVSVFITITGTLINMFFTTTMAYPLSKKDLIGRNFILNCIIFTMVFSGGMIPSYIIVKNLGFINTYWALLIPGAIGTSNLIIVKNFFQELPGELMEAAKIDGCTEMRVLWDIVLPLSKPILATFGLFYAVGHWNSFFDSLLYINDAKKWPLQVILRQMVMLSQGAIGDPAQFDPNYVPPAEAVKMAVIVVGILPIMMVYPFLQKHFAKGVMIGAVKG